ncbi:interleukin-32 isoform X2 [Castor canadensis]|uniref:Interleukin-32 isoform X2 n=1 Tax=Castor canadensis TaxID=51338 RepID=A0AC58LDB3_CASCN
MCYSKVVSRVSQLKDSINENLLDALDLLHESNSPDSTSLPPRVKLELRQRIQGGSGSFSEDEDLESLTSQNGGHKKLEFQTFLDDITDLFSENGDANFWDKMLKCFQEMLHWVKKKWLEVLAWVKQTLGRALEAICNTFKTFLNCLAEFFQWFQ